VLSSFQDGGRRGDGDPCTSLVFCAVGVHAKNIEQRKHAVWVNTRLI